MINLLDFLAYHEQIAIAVIAFAFLMVYAFLVDQLLASAASNGNPGNNNSGVFLKNVPLTVSVTIMAITTAIMAVIMVVRG
jgi:hypothetical protein